MRPNTREHRLILITHDRPSRIHRRPTPRVLALAILLRFAATAAPQSRAPSTGTAQSVELHVTHMYVDVDGAPNAYGPLGKATLDYERNAHRGGRSSGKVVGYLTARDGRTPLVQGPHDPFPGYYISTTDLRDESIESDLDTRKYLDARAVSYLVLGSFAERHGVRLGDLAAVHSSRTHRTVFAIVGDSGNASGAEGSLALLQHLGYPFHDGKEDAVETREITIRYFPGSNPRRVIPHNQKQTDALALEESLDGRF